MVRDGNVTPKGFALGPKDKRTMLEGSKRGRPLRSISKHSLVTQGTLSALCGKCPGVGEQSGDMSLSIDSGVDSGKSAVEKQRHKQVSELLQRLN